MPSHLTLGGGSHTVSMPVSAISSTCVVSFAYQLCSVGSSRASGKHAVLEKKNDVCSGQGRFTVLHIGVVSKSQWHVPVKGLQQDGVFDERRLEHSSSVRACFRRPP